MHKWQTGPDRKYTVGNGLNVKYHAFFLKVCNHKKIIFINNYLIWSNLSPTSLSNKVLALSPFLWWEAAKQGQFSIFGSLPPCFLVPFSVNIQFLPLGGESLSNLIYFLDCPHFLKKSQALPWFFDLNNNKRRPGWICVPMSLIAGGWILDSHRQSMTKMWINVLRKGVMTFSQHDFCFFFITMSGFGHIMQQETVTLSLGHFAFIKEKFKSMIFAVGSHSYYLISINKTGSFEKSKYMLG